MTNEEAKDYIREWCPYDRQDEIIKALSNPDLKYYPPCEDCHTKMDEIRRAYDRMQSNPDDNHIELLLKRMWNWRGKDTLTIDKVAMENLIRKCLKSDEYASNSGGDCNKQKDSTKSLNHAIEMLSKMAEEIE